ncbi:MAG TPA: hypothetical protein VGW75_11715 [Solirubrobacteraceae bacterium]|jgi:hypothetical protein|nr:hypothetical protein [Solirubrobacteraceae bacterium]
MPALSELLKGTVADKLKQLIAPSGLIPAALFVLLTFAFVFPEAKQQGFTPAVEFYDLEAGGWQVAAITLLILIVGYILGSASSGVLDTLSGRTWSHSLLSQALSRWRSRRRDRLDAIIKAAQRTNRPLERLSEAEWRRWTRFAPADSAPTSLGDVVRAAEHGTNTRYGISFASVWEPLRAALPDNDTAVKLVASEKDSLDLMAGLWLALTAFFVEATILFSLWGEPGKVLLSVLTLPPAFVAYRVTVAKTVSWTDAATNVIALHHDTLREKLKMREPRDTSERRELWAKASKFLLLGTGEPAQLFDPAPPTVRVRNSGNVDVDSSATTYTTSAEAFASSPAAGVCHSLIITPACDEATCDTTAQVLISDRRIDRITATPTLKQSGSGRATAEVLTDPSLSVVDTLLVNITGLKCSGSLSVHFDLPRWQLEVDRSLQLRVDEQPSGALQVTVSNPSSRDVQGATLKLFHVLDGPRLLSWHAGECRLTGGQTADPWRIWSVASVAARSSFRVRIELAETTAGGVRR